MVYTPFTPTVDGKMRVSTIPYLFDIIEGNVADHYAVHKSGHNGAVGAALETIWPGSVIYPYMSSADQLEVLSDDDEDGGAGTDTGALTMTIYGLDSAYALQNETITLNGTTIVTTTKSFLRIFNVIVNTAGSLNWNKGNITVRDQDTDATRALLPATFNRSLMAMWTVPAGHTAYIVGWSVSSAIAKVVEAGLFIRPFGGLFSPEETVDFISGPYEHYFTLPEKVEEKGDIEVRAVAGGGGGHVSAGFHLWYEAN